MFTASALALFVELALIRWIPSVVHVVGFFANVVLIASFLGLGVGVMAARRGSGERAVFRLAVLIGALSLYRLIGPAVTFNRDTAYGINEYTTADGLSLPLPVILIGVFALVTWAMIPFGRLIAEVFEALERIPAYTINIAGSLVGIGAFSLLSALGTPSVVWLVAAVAGTLFHAPLRDAVVAGVMIVVALAAVYYVDTEELDGGVMWSPYNQLRILTIGGEIDDGFVIDVNNQNFLFGFDLRDDAPRQVGISDAMAEAIVMNRSYYNFPFEFAQPDNVLILGAGAGNDIAAAKRAGVDYVTAVEIDPRVAQFGADHHPEQPHELAGVEVVVDDARSFLRSTDQRFDLVLFATLDAHRLLSSTGSVRLDSFVYTVESLGANLLGAMVGGILEYGSLVVGYRSLLIAAAVIYLFAYLTGRRHLITGTVDVTPAHAAT